MPGSISVTQAAVERGYNRYRVDWTSDDDGSVSRNSVVIAGGRLAAVKFLPGAAAQQPNNPYSVMLLDSDGADLLVGVGAGLSNAVATWAQPSTIVEAGPVSISVASAGASNSGVVILYVGP